jgi:hypothetical protein
MILLDENIIDSQIQLLRRWRIRVRQIGVEVGRQGMKDEEIIPLLHQLRPVTFLTRDLCLFRGELVHAHYCLVCLAIDETEVARFTRRVLRHPALDTQAKRSGKVIRVSHGSLLVRKHHPAEDQVLAWPS